MAKRTFVYKDDKSDKFWSIEVSGTKFTVNYGKTGTAGQTQVKEFDSAAECKKAAEKKIAEKTKEGYTEGKAANAAEKKAEAKAPAKKAETKAASAKKPAEKVSSAKKGPSAKAIEELLATMFIVDEDGYEYWDYGYNPLPDEFKTEEFYKAFADKASMHQDKERISWTLENIPAEFIPMEDVYYLAQTDGWDFESVDEFLKWLPKKFQTIKVFYASLDNNEISLNVKRDTPPEMHDILYELLERGIHWYDLPDDYDGSDLVGLDKLNEEGEKDGSAD
jgi:predicted DNA-binding WGR domain protein